MHGWCGTHVVTLTLKFGSFHLRITPRRSSSSDMTAILAAEAGSLPAVPVTGQRNPPRTRVGPNRERKVIMVTRPPQCWRHITPCRKSAYQRRCLWIIIRRGHHGLALPASRPDAYTG